MEGKNMSVARVRQYSSANADRIERHNERKNASYENLNVDPERIDMNIHFKDPGDDTYMGILRKKVEDGEISLRGLRQDATLFDEMIIDVNTMYFEEHGGYGFAKEFYEEAYHFTEEKYGSGNIVSAVMHADEINQAATDKLGYPVYHYHMHVMAMPVVEKEILWSKRCKDESLRGTVKEVINQISHSKKWESKTPMLNDDGKVILRANGKPKYIRSYSILQDELYEHMTAAGFKDFERGVRGSTAEHLEPTQYKIRKDMERLEEIESRIETVSLDYEEHRLIFESYEEIEKAGKTGLTGKVSLSQEDFGKLQNLAKEGLTSRNVIANLKDTVERLEDQYDSLLRKYRHLKEDFSLLQEKFDELTEKCRPFLDAMKQFPEKAKEFVRDIRDLFEKKREQEILQKKEQEQLYLLKGKQRKHDEHVR